MTAPRLWLVERTRKLPGVRSPLLSAGCTCGIAPHATCIACARWQRVFRDVAARRAAARGRGGAL